MARGPRVGRSTGFTVRNVNIPDVVLYMFDITVIAACKSLLSDAKYRSLECYFTSLVRNSKQNCQILSWGTNEEGICNGADVYRMESLKTLG